MQRIGAEMVLRVSFFVTHMLDVIDCVPEVFGRRVSTDTGSLLEQADCKSAWLSLRRFESCAAHFTDCQVAIVMMRNLAQKLNRQNLRGQYGDNYDVLNGYL